MGNAAAVLVAAPFGQELVEDDRRVLETGVLGYTLGSRVALRSFEAQGHGSLVDVGSPLSVILDPMAPRTSHRSTPCAPSR